MLTAYANKMLGAHTMKDIGPRPPDAPQGRCPGCGAVGPLTVLTHSGPPRQVVSMCTCKNPPSAVPIERR